MNTHKINILYILSSSRVRKDKKAPIYCRITYNKQRKTFSTGQFVNPKYWNSKQQAVKPPDPSSKLINTQLSLIKTKFNQAFLMLQVKKESFNVNDIYMLYRGKKENKEYNWTSDSKFGNCNRFLRYIYFKISKSLLRNREAFSLTKTM